MKNLDLLLTLNDESKYAHTCDRFFEDMGLDCLSGVLTNVELSKFIEVVKKPLLNIEDIIERQRIFKDLLLNQTLIDKISSVCVHAQKNKFPVYDRVYSSISPKRKLVDYLNIMNNTLKIPLELADILCDIDFSSTQLNEFKKILKNKELVIRLSSELNTLAKNLLTDNVSFQINYGQTFKFKSANVFSKGRDIISTKKSS